MRNSKYKKELLIGLMFLLIVGLITVFYFSKEISNDSAAGYKNVTYLIDGQPVTLKDGYSETEAVPGSASKITTRYFGNELEVDLNNDNRQDIIFLLTQESGGSGTFYYVVAALNTEDGYIGSESYFIGDRIAPQTTELSQNPDHENVIIVNYMDRSFDEPMSAQPSIGKSMWLKFDSEAMYFKEVEQNFEGEADPARMSLTMDDWTWLLTFYNDGRGIEPNKIGDFVLTFNDDGTFSAKTDCNSINGSYSENSNSLTFGQIAMTEMFCEDSQETEFLQTLEETVGYHFTTKGELVLDLKLDSGTAEFQILDISQTEQQAVSTEPERTSVSGEYICLPSKDTTDSQTQDCVYGIKADTGEYYGINFYLMSQTHDPINVGQMISANGVVQDVEDISSEEWQNYPIVGVFSVTDSLEIFEEVLN